MPSKYLVRDFVKGGTYHVYNRGVEKRVIFQDEEDYNLFFYYLFIYLTPLERVLKRYKDLPLRLFQKNLAKELELVSYCLLPDHFHLLLHQKETESISHFMKQVTNAYTQYFNQKYKRTGSLFEGRYKAVRMEKEEQTILLSRFIHRHPLTQKVSNELVYPWSSYSEYTEERTTKLCHTRSVLTRFPSIYSYKKYVQDEKHYLKTLAEIKRLIIE